MNINGKQVWISFQYERLSKLCFNCATITYGGEVCSSLVANYLHKDEGAKSNKSWLRVNTVKFSGGGGREMFHS
jgi:hypothetical protein